jgi:hypothetical protein
MSNMNETYVKFVENLCGNICEICVNVKQTWIQLFMELVWIYLVENAW